MPITKSHSVSTLLLDLHNYRTVEQADEEHAVNALIAIKPDWFWALMESLLDDGYSPTENIIVVRGKGGMVVKEGNRRIASLKIILGLVVGIDVPEHIQKRIDGLPADWKKANSTVPCAIYAASEKALVDKLVSRTHGKGETAGRSKWSAVARARFGRDEQGQPEPGLDLLEAYVSGGKNRSPQQAERWAGDYPLTVLDEAIQRLSPLLGYKTGPELVAAYPKKHRKALDQILLDIGTSHLGFKELRAASPFWSEAYGIVPPAQSSFGGSSSGAGPNTNSGCQSPDGGSSSGTAKPTAGKASSAKTYASNDPKSVRKNLRDFRIRGKGRDKIATLLEEMRTLKHEDHPHAFCFVLRSIFELSAKAYCADHKKTGGPNSRDNKTGNDRSLVDVLRDITNHLTANKSDLAMVKRLHGSMTELAKKDGVLSVTSLNQLIHNPSFSVLPSDICILFGNVFPLLEAMNG